VSPEAVPPRVALLGVCYDGSSSYLQGAAAAPPVIRQALWSEAGNPWTELGVDLSTAALDDEGDLTPAESEDPAQVRRAIEKAVWLSILHFDAHGDLYDEFQSPVASRQSRVASSESPVTSHQLPLASYR
jgi:arginase